MAHQNKAIIYWRREGCYQTSTVLSIFTGNCILLVILLTISWVSYVVFFWIFHRQITNIRTMRPSARFPYEPSRGPPRTKYFTPTTYSQTQEQRRRLLPQPRQSNDQMNDEKELARALALLALPNR